MSRLKVNKNRIMAFVSALVMMCALVVPSVEVAAAGGENDFINNAEPYMVDSNGDGVITYEESFFLVHTSALLTVFGNVFSFNISEAVQESVAYNNFTTNVTADTVLGYITETGEFVSADEYVECLESIRDELVSNSGYYIIPAITKDDVWNTINGYYEAGTLNSSEYMTAYNAFQESDFVGAVFIRYLPNNWGRIVLDVAIDGADYHLYDPANYSYLRKIVPSGDSFSSSSSYFSYHMAESNCYRTGYSGQMSFKLNDADYEFGCIGRPLIVFRDIADYVQYKDGLSDVYAGGSSDFQKEISADKLNSVDWNKLNSTLYTSVVDAIVSSQSSSTSDIQSTIDEKANEIEEYLASIDESLKDDDGDSWLEKIHNLLEKWLPKIFEKDTSVDVDVNVTPEEEEEENNKINDFESDSDSQSSTLDELNEQNKVDKIDVDGASSSVDSHIDMESVGQYGTLLTSVTSHEKVLAMLLGSLSISLIAYVLFGKR